MTTYTGGCACGAVRYEARGEPLGGAHCQCRDCQRRSGTSHSSVLLFPRDAVAVSGTVKYHETIADSGSRVARGFCPECGSPLLAYNETLSFFLSVTAASLDDPERFKPMVVAYAASAPTWGYMDPALPAFSKMPTIRPPQE